MQAHREQKAWLDYRSEECASQPCTVVLVRVASRSKQLEQSNGTSTRPGLRSMQRNTYVLPPHAGQTPTKHAQLQPAQGKERKGDASHHSPDRSIHRRRLTAALARRSASTYAREREMQPVVVLTHGIKAAVLACRPLPAHRTAGDGGGWLGRYGPCHGRIICRLAGARMIIAASGGDRFRRRGRRPGPLARSLIVVAGTIVCARRQGTVTPSVTDVCVRESSLACSWLCVASQLICGLVSVQLGQFRWCDGNSEPTASRVGPWQASICKGCTAGASRYMDENSSRFGIWCICTCMQALSV